MAEFLNVVISGIGLTTDMYDFQVINNVKSLLVNEYGPMSSNQKGLLTSSALIGAVVGMLVFGALADMAGRRTMFICTASLTALGSILSACAWDDGHGSIYTWLIAFRFLMGFGIGGEYPISASHSAESSDSASSGWRVTMTYACMGFGYVLSPLLVYICLIMGASDGFTWRFAFAMGGAISLCGLVLRIVKMRNSERFERAQEMEAARAQKRGTVSIIRTYWKPLLGTCMSWFLYDVIDYGLGLYSAQLTNIVEDTGDAATVLNVLVINTIALPSFFFSSWFVNHIGRKQLQLFGLSGMMAAFLAIFAFYDTLKTCGWLFIALYCTQLSFDNMGPGASTYVIPGEIFPTAVRATAHGLSASSGKVGAFIGTYAMPYLIPDADSGSEGLLGVRWTMALMAGICMAAILWTLLFTPDYDAHTLEQLDQKYEEGDEQALMHWLYGGGRQEGARDTTKDAAGPLIPDTSPIA